VGRDEVTRVLVLGGTAEGRELATALVAAGVPVVSSLAGRVAAPDPPPGDVHLGGFGGPGELATWLGEHRITRVVDATHPFATRITANAAAAATATGVPLLALRRPGWTARPGDRWIRVPSAEAAAAALDDLGGRVLLTTGRQTLAAFAGRPEWFLVRSIDPPAGRLPARSEILLARGPFDADAEEQLLAAHAIDVVVTKDSGGGATAAKLVAARRRSTPVVMIDRPPAPAGVSVVETVGTALAWARATFGTMDT
jgi:precorrin-6A/cobalt-precorrin-6A reductase